jgi:DNA-directed RNA polymerase specialized sigma24 family protein
VTEEEDKEIYRVLLQYARRWQASGLDPEDLAHDAYIKYRRQYYVAVPARSYLYVILSTLAIDQIRHRQRWQKFTLNLDEEKRGGERVDDVIGAIDPEFDRVDALHELLALERFVVQDPRVVLLIPPLGYLTDDELVERYGGTSATFKALRYKARQTVRGRWVLPMPVRNQLILRIAEELGYGKVGTVRLRRGGSPQGAG